MNLTDVLIAALLTTISAAASIEVLRSNKNAQNMAQDLSAVDSIERNLKRELIDSGASAVVSLFPGANANIRSCLLGSGCLAWQEQATPFASIGNYHSPPRFRLDGRPCDINPVDDTICPFQIETQIFALCERQLLSCNKAQGLGVRYSISEVKEVKARQRGKISDRTATFVFTLE